MTFATPLSSAATSDRSSERKSGRRPKAQSILWPLLLASVLVNLYLVGLFRSTPGSFAQLRAGSTASYVGTVTKASARSLTVETVDDGTKRISANDETAYAIFPKDYQTLIPVGLPSSSDDVVSGSTEANVSVRTAYLSGPTALRVNLVRDDMLTGKVIEVAGNAIKFKGFAASGAVDETRNLASNAEYLKFSSDGTFSPTTLGDVKTDMGLYAYLDKPAIDPSGQITKLVVADFTATE